MGLRVTMAGQDITAYVDEMSIQASDILGQGPGTTSVNSGRSATCQFNTTLGPASTAVGAGNLISSPTLARLAELQIYDASNTCIFGGYVGKIDDATDKKQLYSVVYGYDWYQEIDRIQVNTYFSGVSDVQMIQSLCTEYAPWLDLSLLPASGSYQFTAKVFKAVTLQQSLNAITDVTGFIIWVDSTKHLRYEDPENTSSAPFSLSDTPDFHSSFQFGWDKSSPLEIDDTSTINRVFFYGGKKLSNNFVQDLSTQANGSNTVFVLAYYPHPETDGNYHIQANGSGNLIFGFQDGTGAANTLISAGGTAQVLLNTDAHTLTFNTPPADSGPGSVTAGYRYDFPMVLVVTDQESFKNFGRYLDGVISDDSIFDAPTGVARCRTLLAEQAFGLTTLKMRTWTAGLKAAQTIHVKSATRSVNESYLIQEVDLIPLGGGKFAYDLTLGAWSWNMVDVIMAATNAAFAAGVADTNDAANGVVENAVQVEQMEENLQSTMVLSTQVRTYGQYYARLVALGDGHDAYCGLFSVSS
jgi:hypothetical protein